MLKKYLCVETEKKVALKTPQIDHTLKNILSQYA